jgi:hypothetical protein
MARLRPWLISQRSQTTLTEGAPIAITTSYDRVVGGDIYSIATRYLGGSYTHCDDELVEYIRRYIMSTLEDALSDHLRWQPTQHYKLDDEFGYARAISFDILYA